MRIEGVAFPHVNVAPDALLALDVHDDVMARVHRRDAMAGTFAHARAALAAQRLARIHLVVFELGVGEQERDTLQRPEIRRQEHLRPADFAKSAGDGAQAELELKVGRHVLAGTRRARELHAAMMGRRVLRVVVDLDLLFGRERRAHGAIHVAHAAARARVAIGERLVAGVLDDLPDMVETGWRQNLVDAAVGHGRILVELRALLDATLHPARDAEHKADHRLRLREQELRVHFVRRARHARNRPYAAHVGARLARRLLDHRAGEHVSSSTRLNLSLSTDEWFGSSKSSMFPA